MATLNESPKFDAFISYRRKEATKLARWIQRRLQTYQLPPEVLTKLNPDKQKLHLRWPKVFLDLAYEKPASDFLAHKIFPALDNAQRLILISTPSASAPIQDSQGNQADNWLVQEIDRFLGDGTGGSRPVDLVLVPGGSEDKYPVRLANSKTLDWVDLRGFNRWRAWGWGETLDNGFTMLAAGLYDVPLEALPLLRQEERRRRNRILLAVFFGALFAALGIIFGLGLSWWIADSERRFAVARGLLENCSIPYAVEELHDLGDGFTPRSSEAQQLLHH